MDYRKEFRIHGHAWFLEKCRLMLVCDVCERWFEPEEGSESERKFICDGCVQDMSGLDAKELGEIFGKDVE